MAKPTPVHIEKYLKGVDYPASKDDLLTCAQRNGADQETCDLIKRLPDQRYEKPTDVTRALGSHSGSR